MRAENWPLILDDQIKAAADRPFAWGVFDCVMFAADVVLAMTGVDYAEDIRGRYKSERGSKRRMADSGYESLAAAVTAKLGEPLKSVYFLQRGDIAICEGGNGPTVAVCIGASVVAPAAIGLQTVPLSECSAGWRV